MANTYRTESNNVDSPAFQSLLYRQQLDDLCQVDDCFAGQRAIRAGGKKYLRQFPAESDEDFKSRIQDSTFWGAYRRTITGLVGTVFRVAPVIDASMNERLKAQLKNVDLMGTHFDQFAREVFQWCLNDGHGAILVDMPESITKQNPSATLPDERNAMRPVWAFYRKGQIINWQVEQIEGKTKLTSVTLLESVMKRKGKYGQELVRQYRILYPGRWELYQLSKTGIEAVKEGTFNGVEDIPLAIINCNSTGVLCSDPCLLDLSNENLRHYKLQSALDNILQVANVPWAVKILGEDDGLEDQLAAGKLTEKPGEKPRRVVKPGMVETVGKGGDMKFIEHGGKAIEAAQKEISTTARNMAALGLATLQVDSERATTATEEVHDWEMETSALGGYVRVCEIGFNRAFDLSAEYQQLDRGSECKMNRDFTRAKLDGAMVTALATMTVGDPEKGKPPSLSLETLWETLQRGNVLTSEFNSRDEFGRLVKEAQMLFKIRQATGGGAGTGAAA